MIHRVEFGRGARQQPHFDAEFCRHFHALIRRVRRAAIFKEDDAPPAPMRTNHPQESLMRFLYPLMADEEQRVTASDVEHSVQDALAPVTSNRHASLFATPTIATVKRRRLRDDRLVE